MERLHDLIFELYLFQLGKFFHLLKFFHLIVLQPFILLKYHLSQAESNFSR